MPLRARRRRRERRGRRRVCAPTLSFPPFPLPRQIIIHPYRRGVSSLRSARVHMWGTRSPSTEAKTETRPSLIFGARERERGTARERDSSTIGGSIGIGSRTWSPSLASPGARERNKRHAKRCFRTRTMANLMSELERFEQEMKELGSETTSLPPPPPPPPIAAAAAAVRGPLPPPPPPPPSVGTGLPSATFLAPPPPPPPPATTSGSQFSYPTAALPPPPPPPSAASSSSMFPVPFHLQQQYQAPPQYNPASSQSTYAAQPQPSQYQYPTLYQQPATSSTLAAEPTVYPLPQQQQAQKLFQRDAQTITPEALESVKAALASGEGEKKAETKKRAIPRKAAGQTWEDSTLAEWPDNDHRLFCGDLGNEVNDEVLTKAFTRFASFNMARVVRDKRTGKTKGFGFVSFSNPSDLALAFKEMNGKYVGNRPIKLRKSTWKERIDTEAQQHMKHKKRHKPNNPPPQKPPKAILHK